jgi:hypothetical protein
MKIPPRALNAANRILARIPSTKWTPAERDVAAAIIGNETGQERAIEVCKLLLEGRRLMHEGHETGGAVYKEGQLKIEAAEKMAELALRR